MIFNRRLFVREDARAAALLMKKDFGTDGTAVTLNYVRQ
jgi:hypothetical protein